jgi:elongation factor P
MPNINAGDFKKGLKVLFEGDPYEMLECNFEKPGKGQALYRTRLRNLLNGKILDRTYRSGDSLEEADIRRSDGQYLYRDGTGFVFMDNETFEQYSMPFDSVGDQGDFLLEGAECSLLFWNGQLIDFTPPASVVVEVTYTEPAARGDTATNVTKPATVETGATVQVPAFIQTGEKIRVNAQTGEYQERAKE